MRRIRVRSFVLMVSLALTGTGAAEASAVCTQLKSQLASISRSAGSSANYQRYSDAVNKQDTQIRQVQSDLKRFGCTSGSIIVLGGQNAEACAKLASAHKKMRINVAALERKRDSFANRDTRMTERRIQAALKANACDGKRASVVEAALKGKDEAAKPRRAASPGLVSILGDSGGQTRTAASGVLPNARIMVEPQAARGGDYRTLCVRSCDGFFFPISSRAMPSDFARDERTCQMMCPGTGTELYFHAADRQESEEMVSARTGLRYVEMSNAFAYRNADAPMSKACGCNMSAFHKEMERREAILKGETTSEEAPVTTWVRPVTRPDPGEDPETMLEADLRLTSQDVSAVLSASRLERPLSEERRQVRMVGPTFLPDDSEQLDLKAPPPSLIR